MVAVTLMNSFSQKDTGRQSKKSIKAYINQYVTRPSATEAFVFNSERMLELSKKLMVGHFSEKEVTQLLGYEGTAFNDDAIAISRKETLDIADLVQKRYDQGYAVRKLVISFDNEFLQSYGAMENPIRFDKSNLRGMNVDEVKLRRSVYDAMQALCDLNDFKDPHWIAAIQTDTQHAHAHVVLYDKTKRGKLTQSSMSVAKQVAEESIVFEKKAPRYEKSIDKLKDVAKQANQNLRFNEDVLARSLQNLAIAKQISDEEYDEYTMALMSAFKVEPYIDAGFVVDRSKKIKDLVSTYPKDQDIRVSSNEIYGIRRDAVLKSSALSVNLYKDVVDSYLSSSEHGEGSKAYYDFARNEMLINAQRVDKQRYFNKPYFVFNSQKQDLDVWREQLLEMRSNLLGDLNSERLKENALNEMFSNDQFVERFKIAVRLKRSKNNPISTLLSKDEDVFSMPEYRKLRYTKNVDSDDMDVIYDCLISTFPEEDSKRLFNSCVYEQSIVDEEQLSFYQEALLEYQLAVWKAGGCSANELVDNYALKDPAFNSILGRPIIAKSPEEWLDDDYFDSIKHVDMGSIVSKKDISDLDRDVYDRFVIQTKHRQDLASDAMMYLASSGQNIKNDPGIVIASNDIFVNNKLLGNDDLPLVDSVNVDSSRTVRTIHYDNAKKIVRSELMELDR